MAKLQNRAGTTSPIQPLVFALANLAASQTDTDVPIVGGVNNTYALPLNGSIVGYAIQFSETVTAGSLEFDLEIDGTSTFTIETDTAATTEYYNTIEYGNETFLAGSSLGVTYTSDGSLAPLTIDANIIVYVMFEGFDV